MSKYRVKHFFEKTTIDLEERVDAFIKYDSIEVLKYTLHPIECKGRMAFIGVLEYEVEDD